MYAQIRKEDNIVVLIGGEEVGLPVYDHPLVKCIDVGHRTDIEVGMKYDSVSGEFFENMDPPEPQILSIDKKIETLQNENKTLKSQLQAQSDRSDFVEECIAEMATLVYV